MFLTFEFISSILLRQNRHESQKVTLTSCEQVTSVLLWSALLVSKVHRKIQVS
jgi:hypothetical protein